jgi:hypothetical protein
VLKAWFRAGGMLAIVGAVAAGALTAREQGWPSDAFWADRDSWVGMAIAVVGVIAVVEPGWHAAREYVTQRRERQRGELGQLLRATLIDIADEVKHAVSWYDIGLHVWELRRDWRLRRRLDKRASLRMNDARRAGGIEWRRGMGVIGRCWATGGPHRCDFSALTEEYVKNDDVEGWEALSEEERWGMDWVDMQRAERYGGIFAVPMYKGGRKPKFRGCVSLDGPPGSFRVLADENVQDLLRELARSCASALYYSTDGT